jgi:hypothetical protein
MPYTFRPIGSAQRATQKPRSNAGFFVARRFAPHGARPTFAIQNVPLLPAPLASPFHSRPLFPGTSAPLSKSSTFPLCGPPAKSSKPSGPRGPAMFQSAWSSHPSHDIVPALLSFLIFFFIKIKRAGRGAKYLLPGSKCMAGQEAVHDT